MHTSILLNGRLVNPPSKAANRPGGPAFYCTLTNMGRWAVPDEVSTIFREIFAIFWHGPYLKAPTHCGHTVLKSVSPFEIGTLFQKSGGGLNLRIFNQTAIIEGLCFSISDGLTKHSGNFIDTFTVQCTLRNHAGFRSCPAYAQFHFALEPFPTVYSVFEKLLMPFIRT